MVATAANDVAMFRHIATVTTDSFPVADNHSPNTGGSSRCRLDYGNGVITGLPPYLVRRIQSVLNSSARPICHLRRSQHIADALVNLHRLCVPERIQHKIAVLTYKVLQGTASCYLGPLVRLANLPSRRGLCSANTTRQAVPPYRPSTTGSRAFNVAAS